MKTSLQPDFKNIRSINSNLSNMTIGGRNYLTNSDANDGLTGFTASNLSVNTIVTGNDIPGSPPPELTRAIKNEITGTQGNATTSALTLEPGSEYIVSAWVYIPRVDGENKALRAWYVNSAGWNALAYKNIDIFDTWHKVSLAFTAHNDYPNTIVGVGGPGAEGGIIYMALPKLERGSTVSDWTPSPNDMTSIRVTAGGETPESWGMTSGEMRLIYFSSGSVTSQYFGGRITSSAQGYVVLGGTTASFTLTQGGGGKFYCLRTSADDLNDMTDFNAYSPS